VGGVGGQGLVNQDPGKPTNLRAKRASEQRRLFWIVTAFLTIVGGATIALVYGRSAAVLGLACLLVGAGILGILWLILHVIERLAE
jgi:predicted cobalt transporter CbtA